MINKILDISKIAIMMIVLVMLGVFICTLTPLGPVAVEATPFYIKDWTYSSSWNGLADFSPSLNSLYDYLHQIDPDDSAEVDLDEIGNPGGNTSINVGTNTVTLDGTAGDMVFDDGNLTTNTFTSSGSNQYMQCTSAGTPGVTATGQFCYNSTTYEWDFYIPAHSPDSAAKYQMATTASTQTLTNKTFDGVILIPVCGDVDSASNTMFGNHVAPSGSNPPAACADQSYHHYTAFAGSAQDEIIYIIFIAPPDLTGTDLGVRLALTRTSAANPPTSGVDDEMRWLAAGCSILEFDPQTCTPGTDGASMEDDLEGADTQWDVIYSDLITFTVTNLAPNRLTSVRITRDVAYASMTKPYQEDLGLTHVSILYSKSTTDSF